MNIDITKPETIRRRDGGEFEIWKADDGLIYGRYKRCEHWYCGSWHLNGTWIYNHEDPRDLIQCKRQMGLWVVLFADGSLAHHDTEEEAREYIKDLRGRFFALKYIEAEEGEGL